jgi:hypothetical protein
MTTKKFVRGLIVIVALCLSAAAGRAQDSRFFLMGGASSLLDKRTFSEAYIPYSTRYATGGKVTVGLEAPLRKSKTFGVEVSYGLGENNLKLYNMAYSPAVEKGYSTLNNRLSGDLIARAPTAYHGAHPYFVIGLEYDRFSPTSSAQSLATKEGFAYWPVAKLASQGYGGFNFGGGLDFRPDSKLGLRIDVRDHITSSPTLGLPYAATITSSAYFPISGSANNIEYSIGIVYRFGK